MVLVMAAVLLHVVFVVVVDLAAYVLVVFAVMLAVTLLLVMRKGLMVVIMFLAGVVLAGVDAFGVVVTGVCLVWDLEDMGPEELAYASPNHNDVTVTVVACCC